MKPTTALTKLPIYMKDCWLSRAVVLWSVAEKRELGQHEGQALAMSLGSTLGLSGSNERVRTSLEGTTTQSLALFDKICISGDLSVLLRFGTCNQKNRFQRTY